MHLYWLVKVGNDDADAPAGAVIRGRRFWLWVMTTVTIALALFLIVVGVAIYEAIRLVT